MMYLKIMSAQDLPDSDSQKDFILITIGERDKLVFDSNEFRNTAIVIRHGSEDREIYGFSGNCYILNAHGKTIASRSQDMESRLATGLRA